MTRRTSADLRRMTLAAACALCLVAVAAAQASAPTLVTTAPVSGMYSAPTRDSDIVSQAVYGTSVVALEEKDGWTRVRTPDDYTGWIGNSNLQRRTNGAYGQTGEVVQVRSFFANIYREKSVTMHEPVLTVPFETRLEVAAKPTAEDERWYQVKLVSGGTAFVQAGDVAPLSGALSIPEAIQLAKRFLGFSYLWGGSSAYGYDCSGFMQMLMRQRGLIMPRDADLQAAWTGLASVDKEKVQAGDLLYFGSAADKITHTGMYIGERQFIHSTTHARPVIQIGNLDEEPWSKLLVAVRRPKS